MPIGSVCTSIPILFQAISRSESSSPIRDPIISDHLVDVLPRACDEPVILY